MKKIKLLLSALLITATACNKIDTSKDIFDIIFPVEVTPWDPEYAKTVVQKIYVEKFTGHTCTFCPDGARKLKIIMDEDQTVIATAIHCSFQANPTLYFPNDFKTPMGNIIEDKFNIRGLPQATINRLPSSSTTWQFDREQWGKVIGDVDRNNVRAGIQLQCSVDETKQEIAANVAVTILKELPNPVQICLVLQQDSIISWQIDGGTYIPDYVHNHMLRAGFNGNLGTKLTPDGMVTAELKYSTIFKLSYKNSFPNSFLPVVIKDCSVVAYLIDMKTNEVLQVEYVHLHE